MLDLIPKAGGTDNYQDFEHNIYSLENEDIVFEMPQITHDSRKPRLAATRGLILLAWIGFAFGDSASLASGSKLPPPPPPLPPVKKVETSSTQKSVDNPLQQGRNDAKHPPPPPRYFIDAKDRPNHESTHIKQTPPPPLKKFPPPPLSSMAPGNLPIIKKDRKLPPPPPPKREVQRFGARSEQNERKIEMEPQRVAPIFSSRTNSSDVLQISQQNNGEEQTEVKKQEEEKTSVEIMQLQDDEPEVDQRRETVYSPVNRMATKAFETTPKEPSKPVTDLPSDFVKGPDVDQPEERQEKREMQFETRGEPLRHARATLTNFPSDFVKGPDVEQLEERQEERAMQFETRGEPLRHARATLTNQNEYLPQQQSLQREPRHIPQGPQYAPPRQQGRYGQPPAQFSIPPNQYTSRPPRYGMQPPPKTRPTASSTWKSLWGKVEKGLDGMANIEILSEKAQQLVSSVSPASLSRRLPLKQQLPTTTSPATRRVPGKTSQAQNPVYMRQNSRYSAISEPSITYGGKFQEAKAKPSQSKPSVSVRRIDWNDLTAGKKIMIRANGGASAPHGQSPFPPAMLSSSSASNTSPPPPPQGQASPTQNSSHSAQFSQTTNASPYGANPYQQSSNIKSPSKIASDPHSRASRIPWDTATPSRPKASVSTPTVVPPSSYDGDDDASSWKERLSRLIPRIPRLPSLRKLFRKRDPYQYANIDAWKDDDEENAKGFMGLFRRRSKRRHSSIQGSPNSNSRDTETLAPPLRSMMARCDNGKTTSLIKDSDKKKCRSIGRYKAVFDIICVMFLVRGMQQVAELGTVSLPTSFEDLVSTTLPLAASLFVDSLENWAPFLFAFAYLTMVTKNILYEPKMSALASSAEVTVEDESQYVQLYLRLVAGIPMDPKLPKKLGEAAASQVRNLVSSSQLNAFVTTVLSLLVIMTVSVLRPVLMAILSSFSQFIFLEQWRSWPIAWKELAGATKGVSRSLYLSLESLIAKGLANLLDNPLHFAFQISIFGSLLATSLMPRIEERHKVMLGDEDEVTLSPLESAEQLSKVGTSSASRLSLLSENGSVENALERWRVAQVSSMDATPSVSLSKLIRVAGYAFLTGITAIAPLVVSFFVGESSIDAPSFAGFRWDSVLDVSVILFFAFLSVNKAIKETIVLNEKRHSVQGFLTAFSKTVEEIQESNSRPADIQFMASVSPTAGLTVKDLWAAHTTKRAWAVRGANLHCKNGEVLALLGDDGAGKTRMLTTIAESLIAPPKRSRTSNKVRGYIGVGGVENSKWDVGRLKRKMGILLSDVRTMGDTASLFSGWTMEEILEPVDGLRTLDPSHKMSSNERCSIISALKVSFECRE